MLSTFKLSGIPVIRLGELNRDQIFFVKKLAGYGDASPFNYTLEQVRQVMVILYRLIEVAQSRAEGDQDDKSLGSVEKELE